MNSENIVVVLGAGKSGIAATKVLLHLNSNVILYDENKNLDIEKTKQDIGKSDGYVIRVGNIDDNEFLKIKLCIISPGFPKFKEIVMKLKTRNIPIISELELGYLVSKGNICAVTGSNGKTTTVNLIADILRSHYSDVHLLGNVGTPFCQEALNTTDNSVVALEVSSFQLEAIDKFRPNVACILNLSPDHLDRYNHYIDYVNAKLNIAANQTSNDYLILNYEDNILRELAQIKKIFKSRIVFFSSKRVLVEGFYLKDGSIFFKNNSKNIKLLDTKELNLLGEHNFENVMAAMAVAYYMGVSFTEIVDVCKVFKPIAHRIEFVRKKSGINFYNDSKATNPDAAIKAIDAMNGRILLIAGGYDKGVDFGDFVSKVKEKVKNLILIGDTKRQIGQQCRNMNYNNVIYADTLEEAVLIANSYANIGDNILLSPACASYDMFKNYEERGNKFKEIVMNLK